MVTRHDADLIFLRCNRALYDREAFYTAAEAHGVLSGGGNAAAHAAGGWVRLIQSLLTQNYHSNQTAIFASD